MIHIMKSLGSGVDTQEIEEDDFPMLDSFLAMEKKMKDQGCKTIVVKLESGFQVMYNVPT